MDKNIGILHLSDFHINEKNHSNIEKLIKLLYSDVGELLQEAHAEINMVCITGDLINSGQQHASELDMAFNLLGFNSPQLCCASL